MLLCIFVIKNTKIKVGNMKQIKKFSIGAAAILVASSLSAATYTVQPGDTVKNIALKLGFHSIEEAGIDSVPSGNLNLIYPGDVIHYFMKKKKKRFVQKERDLGGFCFEDAHSIHYRASQRCK